MPEINRIATKINNHYECGNSYSNKRGTVDGKFCINENEPSTHNIKTASSKISKTETFAIQNFDKSHRQIMDGSIPTSLYTKDENEFESGDFTGQKAVMESLGRERIDGKYWMDSSHHIGVLDVDDEFASIEFYGANSRTTSESKNFGK